MKSMETIQDEITAILYQFGITPVESALLAVSAYVAHEIMDERQNVFDMIIDRLDKKGV